MSDTETRFKITLNKKACKMNRLGGGGMELALLAAPKVSGGGMKQAPLASLEYVVEEWRNLCWQFLKRVHMVMFVKNVTTVERKSGRVPTGCLAGAP